MIGPLRPGHWPELGLRMSAIADRVVAGEPLADVGTDHAHLVISLVGTGRVPRAVAIDRAPNAVTGARRNVAATGLADRIDIRLADGLGALSPGEVATVVVAGVGNRTIAAVLEGGGAVLPTVHRVVVQPARGVPESRHALAAAGLRIVDEALVHERGRYHVVVVAEPDEAGPTLNEADLLLGPVLRARRGDLFERWLADEALITEDHLTHLEGQNAPPGIRARTAAYLELLREAQRR